jgi:hypothetical protein
MEARYLVQLVRRGIDSRHGILAKKDLPHALSFFLTLSGHSCSTKQRLLALRANARYSTALLETGLKLR